MIGFFQFPSITSCTKAKILACELIRRWICDPRPCQLYPSRPELFDICQLQSNIQTGISVYHTELVDTGRRDSEGPSQYSHNMQYFHPVAGVIWTKYPPGLKMLQDLIFFMMKLSAGVGFVNFYEKISLRNISQHDKEIFTMRGISRSYHHLYILLEIKT